MKFTQEYTFTPGVYSLVVTDPNEDNQLKVSGLDTSDVKIGDEYKVGECVLRVIGNDIRLNETINLGNLPLNECGVVCEVIEEGKASIEEFVLINRNCGSLFVADIQSLFVDATPNKMVAKMCMKEDLLIEEVKSSVKERYKLK